MNNLAKYSAIAAALTTVAIVILFLWVDQPISAWAQTLHPSALVEAAAQLSLLANHQWLQVVALAGLIIAGVDAYRNGWSPRSLGLVYVCLSFTIALLIGDVLKYSFGRSRPPLLFAHGQYGFEFLMHDDLHHSFPSGHTLRIFSFMTATILLFPRLRLALLALAVLIGISRVLVLRHYPSDVVFGAFIGIMSALWTWRLMMIPTPPNRASPKT